MEETVMPINAEEKNTFIRLVPYLIDCFVVLLWGCMTIFIVGKLINIIKINPGVNFEGILGIYSGVTAVAMTIINFHRGSSMGSESKNSTIKELIKQAV